MAMANTLHDYLERHHAQYDVVTHPHTSCSLDTAALAQIPGEKLAKPVMLCDDMGFVMAVVPSSCQVTLSALNQNLGRHLRLAEEREIEGLFADCELGAIPPMGPAYGIKTVMDPALSAQQEVYCEAGDHEMLVHMDMDTFLDLMAEADRTRCSRPM